MRELDRFKSAGSILRSFAVGASRAARPSEEAQECPCKNAVQRTILDALPAHIAVLSRDGTILSVNKAWRDFAAANSLTTATSAIGANYLAVCGRARGLGTESASEIAVGIRRVLSGELPEFSAEYPCHAPQERRWFQIKVAPSGSPEGGTVVMHLNISAWRLAEEARKES